MTKDQKAILEWLAGDNTGLSSKNIAFYCGFDVRYHYVYEPADPADFDRCLQLLDAVPSLRIALPKMAKLSKAWGAIIARWDDVEESHLNEVGLGWTKGRSAPDTYALMKEVYAQ